MSKKEIPSSVITSCDRCGLDCSSQTVYSSPGSLEKRPRVSLTGPQWLIRENGESSPIDIDLCADCAKNLADWLLTK